MNNVVEELEKLKKKRRDIAHCRSAIDSKLDNQAFGDDMTQEEIDNLNKSYEELGKQIEEIDNKIEELEKKIKNKGGR